MIGQGTGAGDPARALDDLQVERRAAGSRVIGGGAQELGGAFGEAQGALLLLGGGGGGGQASGQLQLAVRVAVRLCGEAAEGRASVIYRR